ncbi:MAG: HAMP domain-containing histidine kinase [Alphaproteobacteria bacterium]|nr:HAMP domain-containing histidine kinase [Alphaproteobacteria bacterium]
MNPPRGSAFTLISIATGLVVAVAVALAWFPLVRERQGRALEDQAQKLEVVAALAVDRLLAEYGDGPPLPAVDAPQGDVPMSPAELAEVRSRTEKALPGVVALADLKRVVVVDSRGRLIGSEPAKTPALYGDSVTDPAVAACELDRVLVDRRTTRALFREAPGGRRQVLCVPLWRPGGRVLGALAVVADSEPVIAQSRERGRDLLVVMSVAGIAALVTIFGIRQLLAPLRDLSQAAGRIASGERGVRVELRGPQEVQRLARALNALASSVESHEDEIGGRIEVVQQVTGMVAHEVRNPLQSLSLLVTLARTEDDPVTRDSHLGLIEDEINGLEGVVQRLLTHSGPLRIVRAETDLVKVVERAAAITAPRASSLGVRLRSDLPRSLEASADSSLLRRAIENLLLNAIEFSAKGGRGQVRVSLEHVEGEVLITVEDDGPGVPVEARERIFQPYVSSREGGTGLGLALVLQVMEAHGGYIRCEDSSLGGARFVAAFPDHPPSQT